jgi:hypothetical protein
MYNSALFGEVHGLLSELSPELPDHWERGLILLSEGAPGNSRALTVTSERYQANDVHYKGPSRTAVYRYVYDPSQGKFMESQHIEVNSNDLHAVGEDLISLFGAFAQC